MNEIKKQYDPVVLNSIKTLLENENQRGKPRFYDVWVDGMKVIEKTNDPERFDTHEQHLTDMTERVVINLYSSTSSSAHIQSRYILSFREEPKQQAQPMNGFTLGEVEARIEEKVSQAKEKWDCELVRQQLAEAKVKLKESEDYADTLADKLEQTKQNLEKQDSTAGLTAIIKDLASTLLNVKKPEPSQLSGNEKPEAEASFKMKSEESSLTEQEKGYLEFGKFIQGSFSEQEAGMLIDIIHALAAEKKNIPTVCGLLNINQQKQETK